MNKRKDKVERITIRIQRKWTENEKESIINYLKSLERDQFEKPTADLFYAQMFAQLQFSDCTVSKLKHKVTNLKRSYITTFRWRNSTGQSILESQGRDAFEKATLKRCFNFYDLDDIFGNRIPIHPSFVTGNELLQDEADEHKQDQDEDLIDTDYEEILLPKPISKVPNNSDTQEMTLSHQNEIYFRKLEIESKRLDFEQEKWNYEIDMEEKRLALKEKEIENNKQVAMYEIEMKYKTQLEIAKLSFTSKPVN